MRIILVIESLMLGGAQRVISILSAELARRGHMVSLVTFLPLETDHFTFSAQVERIDLSDARWANRDLLSALIRNARRLWRLRRAIKTRQAQVAVSFLDDSNTLTPLACLGTGIPVIISQRVDPNHFTTRGPWAILRYLAFPLAKAIVIQSENVRDWAQNIMGRGKAIRVIPNPIPSLSQTDLPGLPSPPREKLIVGMGRLTPQKGFDLLIEAFARVAPRFPDWRLVILGDGPQQSELEELAARLEVADRVSLPGRLSNPYASLLGAGLFVLSSRVEGFPNALLEAMALGVPVISFDCPSGPREIIRHEVDGLLISPGDVNALAAEMARLMEDEPLRRRLGARAPDVLDRFSVARVMDLWEEVLQEVQHNRPAR